MAEPTTTDPRDTGPISTKAPPKTEATSWRRHEGDPRAKARPPRFLAESGASCLVAGTQPKSPPRRPDVRRTSRSTRAVPIVWTATA